MLFSTVRQLTDRHLLIIESPYGDNQSENTVIYYSNLLKSTTVKPSEDAFLSQRADFKCVIYLFI